MHIWRFGSELKANYVRKLKKLYPFINLEFFCIRKKNFVIKKSCTTFVQEKRWFLHWTTKCFQLAEIARFWVCFSVSDVLFSSSSLFISVLENGYEKKMRENSIKNEICLRKWENLFFLCQVKAMARAETKKANKKIDKVEAAWSRELHKTSRVCIIRSALRGEWFKTRSKSIFRHPTIEIKEGNGKILGPKTEKKIVRFHNPWSKSGKVYENFLNEKFPLSRSKKWNDISFVIFVTLWEWKV